jgi:hypothetical protein
MSQRYPRQIEEQENKRAALHIEIDNTSRKRDAAQDEFNA